MCSTAQAIVLLVATCTVAFHGKASLCTIFRTSTSQDGNCRIVGSGGALLNVILLLFEKPTFYPFSYSISARGKYEMFCPGDS